MTGPIRRIVIAGDGLAAWTAAGVLARRLPGVAVAVVPTACRPSLDDLYATVPPDRARIHDAIGIDDRDLITSAQGVFRFGIRFGSWGVGGVSFCVGLGGLGGPIGGSTFDQLWVREWHRRGQTLHDADWPPMEAWSPAAMLSVQNRFAPPSDDPRHPFGELAVSLALDPPSYRALLRAAAVRSGVRITAPLSAVELTGERITCLRLVDGTALEADLFVDASGPDACLLSSLPGGEKRDDWSGWLTADRVALEQIDADPLLPPLDAAIADASGWTLVSPLAERTVAARLYASEHARQAARSHHQILAQSRRERAWIGNCVAIGDAAVEIEPLLMRHLALVHAAIRRIIALLPGVDCAPVETAQYNRDWREEADHLRDWTVIARAVSGRTGDGWLMRTELPEPAAAILQLWREKGVLSARDREPWGREQSAQLLLGAGWMPDEPGALAQRVPEQDFRHVAERRRQMIVAAVAAAPMHADVIARLRGRGL